MNEDSGVKLSNLKVDGGMVANEMLMQFQSDMLNVPVIRPKVSETTALGAAYAAGMAVNFWSGLDELRKNWSIYKEWHPDMTSEMRKKYYLHWKKAVDRTLDWVETSH
jgi:glycerol kinase